MRSSSSIFVKRFWWAGVPYQGEMSRAAMEGNYWALAGHGWMTKWLPIGSYPIWKCSISKKMPTRKPRDWEVVGT